MTIQLGNLSKIIRKSAQLPVEDAVMLIEECYSKPQMSLDSLVESVSSILLHNGYRFTGVGPEVKQLEPEWLRLVYDSRKHRAQFHNRLDGKLTFLALTDDYLNLLIVRRPESMTVDMDRLLEAGIATDITYLNPERKLIYQAPVKILTYKPYGTRTFVRNNALYDQLEQEFLSFQKSV